MNAREIRMGKRDPAALAREAEYQDEQGAPEHTRAGVLAWVTTETVGVSSVFGGPRS